MTSPLATFRTAVYLLFAGAAQLVIAAALPRQLGALFILAGVITAGAGMTSLWRLS